MIKATIGKECRKWEYRRGLDERIIDPFELRAEVVCDLMLLIGGRVIDAACKSVRIQNRGINERGITIVRFALISNELKEEASVTRPFSNGMLNIHDLRLYRPERPDVMHPVIEGYFRELFATDYDAMLVAGEQQDEAT
jgi:hypothetical protein